MKGQSQGLIDGQITAEKIGKEIGEMVKTMIKDDETSIATAIVTTLRDEMLGGTDKFGPEICLSFMSTVGEGCPEFIYKNMAHLTPHLEREPWQMRAGVLYAYASIIKSRILDPKPLPENATQEEIVNDRVRKKAKEEILYMLLDRALDINFSVRSRIMKKWAELVKNHRVPGGFLCQSVAP